MSLTYSDGPFVVPNATAQAGDPVCTVPMSCSDFVLTVDGSALDPMTQQIKVSVSWPVSTADFDVYVYNGNPPTGSAAYTSASSADPEVVTLPVTSHTYTIRVVPFAPAGQTYTATVSVQSVNPPPPAGGGTPQRYINYPAPKSASGAESAGEPSIGVDWNPNVPSLKQITPDDTSTTPVMNGMRLNTGGVAFFTANLNEFRVNFDDCSSPAHNTWEDVTSPTESLETLDPIGFVDHQLPTPTGTEPGAGLGRVFQDQLAGATSLLAFSDDDGNNWTQSQGSGQPAGVDHQTVGGGSYAPTDLTQVPPVVEPPHPTYPHQIYYASQDIGTAFAARSDDGGLTFNAGVPMWNISQCGGLHGHVKVGPDGTVYVPNKSCDDGAGGGSGASVAVSRDNGLTWTIKTIREGSYTAGSGDTDPSVGIGADNTLYVGYQNTDGHPHIAVSRDHGDTWHDVDVGQGVIQNTVFPEVVAGDGDRVSFGFLGTSTGGGYQDANSFKGVWYFYIATSYDRGQTYTLVDGTNGDPVQIGSICTGGTTCGGDRNLLDFNDIQIDAEGRVLAGYADGCVAPQCTAATATAHAPPYNESRSALASVIRQSGGPRLLAAQDPANCTGNPPVCAPIVPGAPRVDSVTQTSPGAAVEISWSTPDNGGSPITGYHVYRRDGATGNYTLIATVGPGTTKYEDSTATSTSTEYSYKVTALNAEGESDSCGEFPVGQTSGGGDPCSVPGITILGPDPDTGGSAPVGGPPGTNILTVQLAQPYLTNPADPTLLVFTINTDSNPSGTGAPGQSWFVSFNNPNTADTAHPVLGVRMRIDATAMPVFESYTAAANSGGTYDGRFFDPASVKPAQPGSNYDGPGGKITIVVKASDLNASTGSVIAGFNSASTATSDPADIGAGATLTFDEVPNGLGRQGSYTVGANSACSPNALPVAALMGTADGGNTGGRIVGDPPLLVHFDASGSTDSDGTITNYHFDFGDGTSTDSSSPMVDHTYTKNGTFAARLTVTDNLGATSTNVAQEEVEVELPLDDVVSRKTHGGAGDFDIDLLANPNSGAYNTECRAEGSGYLIIYTFGSEYTTGTASSVTVSNGGTVASNGPGPNPNQYQVMLTGVTNAQTHNVNVSGLPVNNSDKPTVNGGNATLNNAVARLDLLQGDTNNDRTVNSGDVGQTKVASGQVVGAGNFRNDDNVDGNLNSADVGLTKSKTGTALP